MLNHQSRLRHLINLGVALGFIIALIGLPQPTSHVAAQGGDGAPIAYGENKPGQVTAESAGNFYFDAEAGDIAQITVLAFGFAPNIQVLDAGRSQILALEANVANSESIELNYPVTTTARYYIVVGGLNGATGQFALSLARGVRELPPGELLVVGAPPVQGTVQTADVPLVYDIEPNPDGSLILKVDSASEGYHPVVSLLDQDGSLLFSFGNPRLLGSAITIAPGTTALKLVIDQGDFGQPANVIVSLVAGPTTGGTGPIATQEPGDGGNTSSGGPDNTIGLLQAPASGCYLSVNQNVNIRSGGSTAHSIVDVLGAGKYLVVTGYNDANDKWYEVMLPDSRTGWIASFVVTTGGSCGSLPVKTYPAVSGGGGTTPTTTATTDPNTTPTATTEGQPPSPTTETAATAAPDNDYNTEVNIKNGFVTLNGQISYPNGDTSDRIFYDVVGFDSVKTSGQIQVTVTCSGSGVENVRINFNNVGSVGPSSCPGNTTKTFTNDSDQGFMRIDLIGGDNALVNWSVSFTAQ